MNATQYYRLFMRGTFFALFLLAPVTNIFRLDLTLGHFIIFGMDWTLGIDPQDSVQSIWNLLLRVFLPALAFVAAAFYLSWHYGRLYCGWLCPHFSAVETINSLMRRASGKPSLWDKNRLPTVQSDGTRITPHSILWWITGVFIVAFSALWTITLLTYLLPPKQIWSNVFNGELTRNQLVFLSVGTTLFCIEFLLARHLFCRFGCAVGLFQSLVWMANPKAMVIGFDNKRAKDCVGCDASCEHACPMRLKPRRIKRHILACTQCHQCVQACDRVQTANSKDVGLLYTAMGNRALHKSARDFGKKYSAVNAVHEQDTDKPILRYAVKSDDIHKKKN